MNQYASIRQTAQIVGVSECFLRRLEKQGKLPGFKSGVKHVVNVPQLQAMLDSGMSNDVEVTRNV